MRRIFTFCLLAWSLATAGAIEPPLFSLAEQESSGAVWAFSRGDSNTAFAFDGKEWSARAVPFAEGDRATAAQTVPLPDGAVGCLWGLNNTRMAVSWHRGKESRVLALLPGNGPEKARLHVDSQNRVWITGNGPEIRRIDTKTGAAFHYDIRPEDLLKTPKNWNTVEAVEDGKGRLWVWTNTASAGKSCASLRGFLIFDGDKAERRDIEGMEGKWFTFLGSKDKKHLWLGVLDDGLYEVDIDTLQATPVPAPAGESFPHVDKVFGIGADWFVIDYHSPKTPLWRLRGTQWERVIEDLGACPPADRAWLPVRKGFLLLSQPSPWFIGEQEPPLRLDWHSGFTAEKVRKILLHPDGSLFAIDQGGAIFHRKIPLPPRPQSPARITEWTEGPDTFSTASPDGCFWALRRGTHQLPWALREWNGERGLDHEVPREIAVQQAQALVADTAGRVWLLPNDRELVAAFFDPRTNAWRNFPKIEAAFEAVKADAPQFIGGRRGFNIPYYSPDRQRITFRDMSWQVAYFDGKTWTRWEQKQIAPGFSAELNSPCFDAAGRLCVNLGATTWRLDEQGWRQIPFEQRYSDASRGLGQPNLDPPEGCVTQAPTSMEVDNQGVYWLTWQRALYKCRDGACARVFSEAEPNPFATGRAIQAVWVDRKGSAFVKTSTLNGAAWFQITPKTAPPQTSLAVEPIEADSVRVRLNAHSTAKVRFRWQLDNEPWQATAQQSIALDSLPSGEHTIKAQALDEELQSDPVPAEAHFEIKIDPDAQLARFIARLADPDYARRKTAIAALARQPERAAPALKAAREKATDDQRWWIDAALQQTERDQAARKSSAP